MFVDETGFEDFNAEPAYAHAILTTVARAPLLADHQLARLAFAGLRACAPDAPGCLWGGVVLPDALRFVMGPAPDDALSAFVEYVRAYTSTLLLKAIRRADDESLDAVLFYNPVWGGAIYRVWATGCHLSRFWTEYRLSGALYALRQSPVAAGMVLDADAWPYVILSE